MAELEDNVPFLELPMDYPRPKTRTEDGSSYCFTLPPELCSGLRAYLIEYLIRIYFILFYSN